MPDIDLGVIGNGVATLIDRRGRIVWYCLPRFESDPVFCSLLDGKDPNDNLCAVRLSRIWEEASWRGW